MLYHISAEVTYSVWIEAETKEEAIEKFDDNCSGIINEIECEVEE